jgi:hypothetical protein
MIDKQTTRSLSLHTALMDIVQILDIVPYYPFLWKSMLATEPKSRMNLMIYNFSSKIINDREIYGDF